MTTDYPKKFKLQTWREKKYRKTTNEMGRWFPGARNRPRSLSLIVDDIYTADSVNSSKFFIAIGRKFHLICYICIIYHNTFCMWNLSELSEYTNIYLNIRLRIFYSLCNSWIVFCLFCCRLILAEVADLDAILTRQASYRLRVSWYIYLSLN